MGYLSRDNQFRYQTTFHIMWPLFRPILNTPHDCERVLVARTLRIITVLVLSSVMCIFSRGAGEQRSRGAEESRSRRVADQGRQDRSREAKQ